MDIILASNNKHKAEELKNIFIGHNIISPRELGIEFNFKENGKTYFENAFGKALALYKLAGKPVLSDDSGLSVIALNGEPGIYSARYGSKENIVLCDKEKNDLILSKMKYKKDRRAYFVCCMVLVFNEYRFFSAEDYISGIIAEKPEGSNGFGYDPIFYISEKGKTSAQLSNAEKNAISHRGRASKHILTIIENLLV